MVYLWRCFHESRTSKCVWVVPKCVCPYVCVYIKRVLEILSAITDGKTPFDMNRMRSILVTQIRGLLNKVCLCYP